MDRSREVALCVTCLVDQIMPEVGVATTRVLRRSGFEVTFPQEQTCCGQPFFNSGFMAEARRLAKHTIETFEPYETVVLPSGSCATMMRLEYPHLLAEEPGWAERAQRLAERIYELSSFVERFAPGFPQVPRVQPTAITYHDSCHMCRLLELKEEPRRALRRAGYEISEMAESERCCGFGGLFSLRMPEVANAMSNEKIRQALETGAAVLVSADPGCLMQIRGLAGDRPIRVVHLATLLEEASR